MNRIYKGLRNEEHNFWTYQFQVFFMFIVSEKNQNVDQLDIFCTWTNFASHGLWWKRPSLFIQLIQDKHFMCLSIATFHAIPITHLYACNGEQVCFMFIHFFS